MPNENFEQFYKANLGLVHKVCQKVYKRCIAAGFAVEYDDLTQEASMTMMRAHEGFNPELGFKFSTYFMRAAFNDLNRFLRSYDRDIQFLHISSMQVANRGEDAGEFTDLEGTIDGGHASPEQVLEAAQLANSIEESLSPLAKVVLQLSIEPTDAMENEWSAKCQMEQKRVAPMTANFVNDYLCRVDSSITPHELKSARREITSLLKEFN